MDSLVNRAYELYDQGYYSSASNLFNSEIQEETERDKIGLYHRALIGVHTKIYRQVFRLAGRQILGRYI